MNNKQKKALFTQAWKEVLGVPEVGEKDNFFEAGGDSVKGMQLVGKLAQKGLKLDMLKLYTEPTVSQLSEQLEETTPVNIPAQMPNAGGMPPFMPNAAAPAPAAAPQMMGGPAPMYYVLVPVYMQQPMFAPQMMAAPQMFPQQPMAAPQMGAPKAMGLGPVTKSAEEALEAVLAEIFPGGYDKQVNLFEQGLDSMKMMQIVSRCAQQGYRINIQDMMKDPTFKGVISCMKTQ